jgi:hypothetical protein
MIYRTSLFLSLFLITLSGKEIESFPSFQGFEGVVNTPNSEVLHDGEFQFLYTNQVDNFFPSSSLDFRNNKKQKNHFLNIGFLPNLDFSLRYSYGINQVTSRVYLKDRIINFKYQIPFIPNDIAQVAFGMQDIAGGAPHLTSKYIVTSKIFNNIRTNIGYAKGENNGAFNSPLNGIFGSVEYQPFSWLHMAGEYDSKECNGVLKSHYSKVILNKKINLGVMAKSSLNYNDFYLGLYSNISFKDDTIITLPLDKNTKMIPSSIEELREFGFSNISYKIEDDTIFFDYENTLYVYSDMDALGMVLGTLATSHKGSTLVVSIKKSNIIQYTIHVKSKAYEKFLKTGKYKENLLKFIKKQNKNNYYKEHSDRFKPTITLQPNFIVVDGSEYGHIDYTLAMQTELSIRLAKGTIFSTRYNIPLSITNNFKDHGIFDYRNRNKTTSNFDQVLLSQFFQLDLPYRWMNLIQLGQFDKELTGASFESGISDLSGKHAFLLKLSFLEDKLYSQMDLYLDKNREERLFSYRYYLDNLNSNIKITAGEFLYGDRGINIGFKRYFSDMSLQLDIAQTTHSFKGNHNVGKLTLSIPFGSNTRLKTNYLDLQGNYLVYQRRKTLVSAGKISLAQPHHLKEVDNHFTLEKYYLDDDKFHPIYMKQNYQRLRNIFFNN